MVVFYLKIDYNRCKETIIILDKYFANKNGIANVEFPESIKYKSKEYYFYMFYSCLLDYGMRSKIYHKNLIETYEKYSNLFCPEHVMNMKEEDIHDIIVNNIHPRYPNVATKKWICLSNELIKYNNILIYLKGISSFNELNNFIKHFKGFGQKTGGLLIRIICDSKICDFYENINSIPIDRHDIEISFFNHIIDKQNISSTQIHELSDTYVKVGQELNVNPSEIDKYLWEIGNSFCNKKNCEGCPLNNTCKKTKK